LRPRNSDCKEAFRQEGMKVPGSPPLANFRIADNPSTIGVSHADEESSG
jgi:hypothetical protein